MPYINSDRRRELEGELMVAQNAGELNYILTGVLIGYWSYVEHVHGYQKINDILGALEGAKLEFYRRIVVPYEEQKIKENGDVY